MEIRRNNRVCYVVKVDRDGRLLQEINTFDSDLEIFHHLSVTAASLLILLQLEDTIFLHGFITLSQHDLLKA